MSYHFINRRCKITISPEPEITIHLTGWITYADPEMLLLTDEEGSEITINRSDLMGSIVVLEEQKEGEPHLHIMRLVKQGYN